MQFSASASSHMRTQANKDRSTLDPDIPSPSDGSVQLVYVNPVFDCWVCTSSPPRVGSPQPGKAGRGRGANWTAGVRRRVLLAASFDLTVAACTAASLTSTASRRREQIFMAFFEWDTVLLVQFQPDMPGVPLPFLLTAASPHLAHHRQHAGSRFSRPRPRLILHYDTGTTSCERQFVSHGRGALCVGWWGLTWLDWVVDFHPEFC